MTRAVSIVSSQVKNSTIYEIALLFLKWFFRRERISIYRKELDAATGPTIYSAFDAEIIKGNLDDLEPMRKSGQPVPWEFCCDLYDGVKDFFIKKNNGAIGHISWIYYKGDPNRIIELDSDEGEIKYSLTLPELRGKGFYPATLIRIQRFLREKGYKRVFICAREDNRPSIKGIEKAGFKRVAEVNLVKIMGVQLSKRYAASH